MVRFLKSKYLGWLLIVIGLVGACVGIVLYCSTPQPSMRPSAPSVHSTSPPSSAKLSEQTIANYKVPPTNPRYIAIPTIHISNTPVLRLGALPSGAIATPPNVYEAGWYDGSALPGQAGAMFIYGHVSSWAANGIFVNLKKLKAGDKVVITRGDNKRYTYQVVSTKIYPYRSVDMQQVLSAKDPGVPGLNLMTCTGHVIRGTSEFDERLVVFTSLTSS